MTHIEDVRRTNKPNGCALLTRLNVMLVVATVLLVPAAIVRAQQPASSAGDAIRPFNVSFPKAALDDLRRRVAATRWPEKETVNDQSQGVPLATMKKLASYWQSDYDWRKMEAKLNSLPQFVTTIDGVDIRGIL